MTLFCVIRFRLNVENWRGEKITGEKRISTSVWCSAHCEWSSEFCCCFWRGERRGGGEEKAKALHLHSHCKRSTRKHVRCNIDCGNFNNRILVLQESTWKNGAGGADSCHWFSVKSRRLKRGFQTTMWTLTELTLKTSATFFFFFFDVNSSSSDLMLEGKSIQENQKKEHDDLRA